MAEVQVRNLELDFGNTKALDDVSLDFANGQIFGLLGPSGSGKTTLLRCIAGFIHADRGHVMIGGEPVDDVPVERREIGMMFQSYALFPNMSVAENIAFGLKVRRVEAADITRRVGEVLDLVQLRGLERRSPHELSGGQRQRVALARAIVTRPRVLLLDEPLSALDKALRLEMQVELRRIQREVGITTIFVTHEQEEALTLSDQIGILKAGQLVQSGPPRALYHAPLDRFTASFLGEANFFAGKPEHGGLRLDDGTLLPWPPDRKERSGLIAVRPEEMMIAPETAAPPPQACVILGEFVRVIFSGPTAICHVTNNDQVVKVLVKNSELGSIPAAGRVAVSWPPSRSMLIPE